MKKLVCLLGLLFLAGCGSHFAAWQGRPIGDLTLRWGAPGKIIPINDVETAYGFHPADDCALRVTTRRGVIRAIEPTGDCNSKEVRAKTPTPQ